jgi:ABC-type sugar transport system permease subunit
VTLPMISPVIFYTLDAGHRGRAPVLPRAARAQAGHRRTGGSTNFLNLYIYKNFFTYQNMSYGATLAWLLFGITLLITLSCSVIPALGLLRRGEVGR